MRKKVYLMCTILLLFLLTACGSKNKEKQLVEKQQKVKIEKVAPKEHRKNITYHRVDSNNTLIVEFENSFKNVGELNEKIKIVPEVKAEFILVKNKLIVRGDFERNKDYLCDLSELTGEEQDVVQFKFEDKQESVAFEEKGILFPNEKKSLSLKTINVKEVDLKVYKIFQNNINSFINNFNFTRGGSYSYNFKDCLDELGEVIYEKNMKIDYKKNKTEYVTINFDKLFDKNGIYALEVNGKSIKKEGGNNPTTSKLIIMSNIGIMVEKTPNNIDVQLVNISTKEPIKDGEVYLMAKNNQTLKFSKTSKDGRANFENSLDKAYYIKAKHGNDINILKLTTPLPLESFDVGGISTVNDNQIYIYADRPEYRPGEEIHANIIIRQNGETLEEGHPVKAVWYDTAGNKEEIKLKWNKNSFYALSKKIPQKAITGVYGLEVEAGDTTKYLSIPVETNIRQKLKSTLIAPKEKEKSYGKYDLSLESHYLYGNPSPNQIVKGKATFVLNRKKFINYEDFSFSLPNEEITKEFPFTMELKDGKSKEEVVLFKDDGEKTEFDNLSNSWNMKLYWEATVLDENTRPNPVYAVTEIDKYKTYIGIKDYDGDFFTVGDTKKVPVVVLDNNGKRVAGHKIKYTIYQKSSLFWYDFYRNSQTLSLKNDKIAQKIKEGEIISKNDKNSYIEVGDLNEGTVYIEVEDLETKQMAGTSYRLSYWQENQKFQQVSKLRISSDKKSYKVGDKLTLLWEANKGSKAYISLEKDGKVFKRLKMDINSNQGRLKLKVTEDMIPNIYAHIVLLQNYKDYDNDRPARLYGVVPIVVEDTKHDVGVKLDLPKEIESKQELSVKISNEMKKPMEYVVSVVDLGLLENKNYTIPNPHKFFFAKRAYQGILYDNYTILLPKNERESQNILTVGGGDAYFENRMAVKAMGALKNKSLGIEKAKRFNNLAMYQGILQSDEKGNLKVSFKLPRYQGAIKVIVTGVNEEYYGASNKDVVVKAPVIMENSAPRTLKIGDKFNVTTRLLQKNKNIEEGILTVEFEGQKIETPIDFKNKKEYLIKNMFDVENKIGVQKIKINFKSEKYTDEDTIHIDVNSINPYSYKTDVKELEPNEKFSINPIENIIPNSGKLNILVSANKKYGIDKRLATLIKYPYGCAEQITSIALSELYLKQLETTKILGDEQVKDNINVALLKLRDYRTEEGFSYWPNSYVKSPFKWLDNYIGEFVVRAKLQGYYINENFYSGVLNNLRMNGLQSRDYSQKIYALWVLSKIQKANASELNYVRESLYNNLDLTDKWLFLATCANQGEVNYARREAKKLTIWDEGKTVRKLAMCVESYRDIFGELRREDEERLLVILSKINPYNTYSTARILMALAKDDEVVEDVSFMLNGEKEITKDGMFEKSYVDNEKVTIKNMSDKKLYVYTFWEGKTLNFEQTREEKGISLARTEIPEINMQGDIINWTLSVSKAENSGLEYLEEVAVTEILPSGLEWEIDRKELEKLGAEQIDIRDDRIILIFSYVGAEKIDIPLKARAITEGKYYFPGTRAEEMYDTDIMGQLENTIVEVIK